MNRSLVIALSGHRDLTPSPALCTAIQKACAIARAEYPDQSFDLVSCLAEGADRLLTREISRILGAGYAVALPLTPEEYKKDFHSPHSVEEFDTMMAGAQCVMVPEKPFDRPEAYDLANQKMLAMADLVIVIWDGLPSRGVGGTGAVVALAREKGLPMIWLRPTTQDIVDVFIERPKGGSDER